MQNLSFKTAAVIVLLLVNSTAFAALQSVLIMTDSGSQPLTYQLADKITKGPIPAGESQQLSRDEMKAIENVSGLVTIIIPTGSRFNCTPFPTEFIGNVKIKAFWQPGHSRCELNISGGQVNKQIIITQHLQD